MAHSFLLPAEPTMLKTTWVTNTVVMEGPEDNIRSFVRPMIDKKSHILNFESLLPTPYELAHSRSPLPVMNDLDQDVLFSKTKPTEIVGISAKEAVRRDSKYGAIDWFSYRMNTWGTKFPGTDLVVFVDERDRIAVQFQTPWCAPRPVYRALNDLDISVFAGAVYDESHEAEIITSYHLTGAISPLTVTSTEHTEDGFSWTERHITYHPKENLA